MSVRAAKIPGTRIAVFSRVAPACGGNPPRMLRPRRSSQWPPRALCIGPFRSCVSSYRERIRTPRQVFLLWLLIAEVSHVIFGVHTPITQRLH